MVELFPESPFRFDQDGLDRLLCWAAARNASDVHLQSFRPIYLHEYGQLRPIIPRPLEHTEVQALTNAVCGEHATALIAGGQDVNPAYSIRRGPGELLRFRINGTACLVDNQRGIHLTIRLIPHTPPPIDTLDLPSDLGAWLLNTHQGLVLVTGPTGSGKTTLMASVLAAIAENPNRHDVILTYEAPIEYVFDEVPAANALIAQSEIGVHIESWATGVRNALRRAPRIILIGESRDAETMAAALEACLTGHAVFTTLHTRGVAETVARIARIFPSEERQQIQVDLIDALYLILTQRLVPSSDGKRVPLREYLCFDQRVREVLYDTDPQHLARATRRLLREYGCTFLQDADHKRTRGLISDETYRWVVQTYYGDERGES